MSRLAILIHKTASPSVHIQTMLQCFGQTNWAIHSMVHPQIELGWTGWQPSPHHYSDESVSVVLDGTLYHDHPLPISDPEYIAQQYHRLGFEGLLTLLNGDFSIVLYDHRLSCMWCARDRFGVKPLYYTETSDFIAIASQPKQLLALPGVSRAVDPLYVALYAGAHYRLHDNRLEHSPFTAVQQLPPAHSLHWQGEKMSVSRYWALQPTEQPVASFTELAQQYRELLLDAVQRRVNRKPNLAFTLSGGMDSSSVLASAVATQGQKFHAFSSVYVDKTFDESDEIQTMLSSTVEEWHQVVIGNQIDWMKIIGEMVAIHDEPIVTATWLSHYLLCQQAHAQGFEAMFGGLGGDELNAGEYEHYLFFFADLRFRQQEKRLSHEIQQWAHYHNHPLYRKSAQVAEEALGRLVDFNHAGRIRFDRDRLNRYAHTLHPDYYNIRLFEPILEHPFTSYLNNRTYQDLTRETIPPCLRAEDRQGMAYNVDHVLPFLDHRLVEFMFNIPIEYKYQSGVSKHLLREAMRGILPEETRTRVKKTGWNAPAQQWFAGSGKETLLRDVVHSQSFRERGIYNLATVESIIQEHDNIVQNNLNQENHMMFLWQLVNLELWLQYVDRL